MTTLASTLRRPVPKKKERTTSYTVHSICLTMPTPTALQSLTKQPWKAMKEALERQPLPLYDLDTLREVEAFRTEPFYKKMLQLGHTWSTFELLSYTAQNPNGFQPFTDLIERWLNPQGQPLMTDYNAMIHRMRVRIQDQVVTGKERGKFHMPYVLLCKPLLHELAFEVPLQTTHAAWIALALVARLVLLLGNPLLRTNPSLFALMSHELERYLKQEQTKTKKKKKKKEKTEKTEKATKTKVTAEEKQQQKQRTCSACAEPGHNQRTCPKVLALSTEPSQKKKAPQEKAPVDKKQRDQELLRMIQSLSDADKEQLYQDLLD
jgi:hypothetical protein